MEKVALRPVRLPNGVVVMHTREDLERYLRGVDVEAARKMAAPLEES
jgi:hypothetical protein